VKFYGRFRYELIVTSLVSPLCLPEILYVFIVTKYILFIAQSFPITMFIIC